MPYRRERILYSGAENASAVVNRTFKGDATKRGIIYSPGRGSFDLTFLIAPYALPNIDISERRWPMISFSSGSTFGNDTIQARIETLRAFFGTRYGAKVDQVHLVCGSMGALNGINYARANPTRVKSMALQVPLTDLIELHDTNAGGFAAEIEAAYSGEPGGWAGQKVAHSPQEHLAEIAALDIPSKVWASTNDPYIPFATAQEYATETGAEFQSMGAVGHDPTLYEPINREILDFLEAHDG